MQRSIGVILWGTCTLHFLEWGIIPPFFKHCHEKNDVNPTEQDIDCQIGANSTQGSGGGGQWAVIQTCNLSSRVISVNLGVRSLPGKRGISDMTQTLLQLMSYPPTFRCDMSVSHCTLRLISISRGHENDLMQYHVMLPVSSVQYNTLQCSCQPVLTEQPSLIRREMTIYTIKMSLADKHEPTTLHSTYSLHTYHFFK